MLRALSRYAAICASIETSSAFRKLVVDEYTKRAVKAVAQIWICFLCVAVLFRYAQYARLSALSAWGGYVPLIFMPSELCKNLMLFSHHFSRSLTTIHINATTPASDSAIVTAHYIPLLPQNSGRTYSKIEDKNSPRRREITVASVALVTDCRYAVANILIAIGMKDIA